jgi:hypothetical protein
MDGQVTGVDINPEWVEYARRRAAGKASYTVADARKLPFANASFDLVVSITALCFISEEGAAVREIVRVARRRFAIGLLNRRSLLWLQKGTGQGRGGYRGAHWHTVSEAKSLFRDLPVRCLRVRTAIQVPDGGGFARVIERMLPPSLGTGAFILVVGDVGAPTHAHGRAPQSTPHRDLVLRSEDNLPDSCAPAKPGGCYVSQPPGHEVGIYLLQSAG